MSDSLVDHAFQVDVLSIEQMLVEWRWLCPEPYSLVARNVFGDLFMTNSEGEVFWLQVEQGSLSKVAGSKTEFLALFEQDGRREEWLARSDAELATKQGLKVSVRECVAFKVPTVFSESREVPNNAYVADIYEYLSFLGDIHRQITNFPDGTTVKLRIVPPR